MNESKPSGSGEHRHGQHRAPGAPAHPDLEPRARRKRGVRLSDLDRSQLWVIGHNGRRWETLGTMADVLATEVRLDAPADVHAPAGAADDAPAGPPLRLVDHRPTVS